MPTRPNTPYETREKANDEYLRALKKVTNAPGREIVNATRTIAQDYIQAILELRKGKKTITKRLLINGEPPLPHSA